MHFYAERLKKLNYYFFLKKNNFHRKKLGTASLHHLEEESTVPLNLSIAQTHPMYGEKSHLFFFFNQVVILNLKGEASVEKIIL